MYVDNVCYVPCVTFVFPTSTSSASGTFQLDNGEFAPGLEPLEFVSGECSSNFRVGIFLNKNLLG